MKTDLEDPTRIAEQEGAPLRRLVQAVRRGDPSDAAMERIAQRLAAESAPAARSASRAKVAQYTLGVLALATAGVLLVTWRSSPNPSSLSSPSAPSSLSSPPAQEAPREPVRVAPEQASAGAISIDDLPTAAPAKPAATPPADATASGAKGAAAMAPAPTELELLQRAQASLATHPERTLAITAEQARRYPGGEFEQEREVIAVEALARLGRKEDAERRALSLLRRFPRTPYAARLALAVGRPLSAATNSRPETAHDEAPATAP